MCAVHGGRGATCIQTKVQAIWSTFGGGGLSTLGCHPEYIGGGGAIMEDTGGVQCIVGGRLSGEHCGVLNTLEGYHDAMWRVILNTFGVAQYTWGKQSTLF